MNVQLPQLPAIFSRIGRMLPQWPPTLALVAALEGARRLGILPGDPLVELDGRTFEVDVVDAGIRCRFVVTGGTFRPASAPPDVAFRASVASFVALIARQEDPDTLFFQRRLVIEGDTAVGLAAKNLLDSIDWATLLDRLPLYRQLRPAASE